MLQQLAHSILEPAINHALSHDKSSESSLKKLNNKSFAVAFTDLSIQVKLSVINSTVSLSTNIEQSDCLISTSSKYLKELQDTAKLTQLIKSDAVLLEGDLKVAQGFSSLIFENNIDWQTMLAKVIGDANAYRVLSTLQKFKHFIERKLVDWHYTESTLITDELAIAPCNSEVSQFIDDVDEIHAATERLIAKFERLKN